MEPYELLEKGVVVAWDEGLMTKEEMDSALAHLDALRGQVAMLREALAPFTNLIVTYGVDHEYKTFEIRIGDIRAAQHAVLSSLAATDPVVRLSGTNKSHGEGVIEAARAIVGRFPQRPSPHGPRPAVMDESAVFTALWDAVQALDAPDGEADDAR
jgi:hypothetical protein